MKVSFKIIVECNVSDIYNLYSHILDSPIFFSIIVFLSYVTTLTTKHKKLDTSNYSHIIHTLCKKENPPLLFSILLHNLTTTAICRFAIHLFHISIFIIERRNMAYLHVISKEEASLQRKFLISFRGICDHCSRDNQ